MIPSDSDKKCFQCGKSKPHYSFDLNARSNDGLHSTCKACFAINNALRYNAKKEGRVIRIRNYDPLKVGYTKQ